MIRSLVPFTLTSSLVVAITPVGYGQCEVFDLESFAPGTVAMNLIPGVTFTCEPGSCGAGLPLPEIAETVGGDGGTINAIRPHEGCPGASPDSLLMTFDENQSFIQFGLGANIPGLEIRVRWFNEFGTPLGTRFYDSGSGLDVLVTIDGPPIIRSVDVWQVNSSFEYIGNLRFGEDTTTPTVEIDSPVFNTCVCGDSSVSIVGTVDDSDGVYDGDTAEYRAIHADESEPWTTFGTASGAFSGTLYTWSTIGVPAGRHYVRVTGMNECGLRQSDLTVVRIDRSFGTLSLASVAEPLCGVTTIKGGIDDSCGVTWELDQRRVSGGGWLAIASGEVRVVCEIADWDTTGVPDGAYQLRLRGTDGCGHTAETVLDVVVDNSDGCGCTADINGDGVVDFTDLLLVLAQWTF